MTRIISAHDLSDSERVERRHVGIEYDDLTNGYWFHLTSTRPAHSSQLPLPGNHPSVQSYIERYTRIVQRPKRYSFILPPTLACDAAIFLRYSKSPCYSGPALSASPLCFS